MARRELADDALQGDPAEHPRRRPRRLVPHARDRDGRVHDREPLGVPDLPDLHPVHQRDARPIPAAARDADELRDHLGGDALAALRRPQARRAAPPCRGEPADGVPRATGAASRVRRRRGARRHQDRARRGRVPLAARAVGLRQDDGTPPRRRLRPPGRGRDRRRRQGHDAASRPTSATWAWSSRRTRSSRT